MSTNIESKIGSTIYARLNAMQLSEVERRQALAVLHDAERFVEGIAWVAKKIERLFERLFLKPSLKH